MTADPRRVASLHRWTKWVWVIGMVPATWLYFVMDQAAYAALMLLVMTDLTLFDTFLGQSATEQGAESRFPEEENI